MKKLNNTKLSNSLGLEVEAEQLFSIDSLDDVGALTSILQEPCLILGQGTNVVLAPFIATPIIKVAINDIEVLDNGTVSVGAGLPWSDLIKYCLDNHFYGLENLTLIPGTVGAAPVQNIGAYGVEVSDFIESVTCYDGKSHQVLTLSNSECQFDYRQSIFQSNECIVLRVNFKFSKSFSPVLTYPALLDALTESGKDMQDLLPDELSRAVQNIRQSKLPDPAITSNVGSIFKNPIVATADIADTFLAGHRWELPNGFTKLSAARLLELLDFEIPSSGSLDFSATHSLVLVNNGGATFDEVTQLLKHIQSQSLKTFNVDLEIEPEIITS